MDSLETLIDKIDAHGLDYKEIYNFMLIINANNVKNKLIKKHKMDRLAYFLDQFIKNDNNNDIVATRFIIYYLLKNRYYNFITNYLKYKKENFNIM